jgi:predicted PurR-regulated permease PerM
VATGGRREYDWKPWAGGPGAARPLDPSAEDRVEGGTPNRRVRPIRSSALNGLFVLACVYTLAVARSFLVPLAIGLMLYFLLRPPVRTLKSVRVPEPLGAALVLGALLAVVGVGFYALSWPAASWTARAPESLHRVESKLRPIARHIQRLTRTAEDMGRITEGTVPPSATPQVMLKEPSLGTLFMGGMQSFLAGTVVVLSMVYFLLSEGDGLLRKVVRAFPRLKDRERAVVIAHEMEQQISGYIFFSTLMNAIFGVLIAAVMWLLGMPNPML